MLGKPLPPPNEVVSLYKSKNIGRLRLYAPDIGALKALRGSDIEVIVGTSNEELKLLASSKDAAANWVNTNVRPYSPDVKFRYIAVGNEVIPGQFAEYVLPAMQNIYNALGDDLRQKMKVSTAVHMFIIGDSYPPSKGAFSQASLTYMKPIARFLADTGAPLLLNVYPYFAHRDNPKDISLNYATFTSPNPMVRDGSLSYQNLFDAMVDSVYSALEKAGTANLPIVVSESGWPSAGGPAASVDNARTYNTNLIKHVEKGTPKKPGPLETYIFAMFNENQKKGAETERHFGLFYPNKEPVYPITF
ncbi:Glucan endo-1,3-beta-glucosidase [Acorus calamus]|uniref:Glucan endo-1,3-beta-glucosidase n=1 Tax=Acorus calamus TaxID=4465 RepID=A0AAV9CZ81_ACOCL|nr:Glucan endo-1,3-beta-glucosidase [Acorus calamus]